MSDCYWTYIYVDLLAHPPAFGLDSEQPDYDMDSEDETLLNRLNRKMELKPLQFEVMVDRLEKASANQVTKYTCITAPLIPSKKKNTHILATGT